ncbi:ABC transporter ATP-binding protein [uncultured Faecalibaculum sp.]|uniref:ABC transporter ATP-binding protein n=1 Tax=uncultured Faecalibaculum sp. TaxID=1729681 RepID=UPI0025E50D1C|nr:ABC transporter ATP-binding protein [uncultured Faecalibaculum sp.]
MQTMVQADNLVKVWNPGPAQTIAVDHATFSVQTGTFTVITGKSGCGKSTLLSLLAGLESADEGTIIIDGRILERSEKQRAGVRRESVGLVHQFFQLIPELTIRENLQIPFDLNGLPLDEFFVKELIRQLELEGLEDRYPHQLSGGQQQRAAIVRALAIQPAVVLADEPTGNLDRLSAQKVMKLIRQVQRRLGITVIMVTHDLDLARQADRILYMEDGRISGFGSRNHE